jgi:hypothetical protein
MQLAEFRGRGIVRWGETPGEPHFEPPRRQERQEEDLQIDSSWKTRGDRLCCGVELTEAVRCPFCGQTCDIVVDTTIPSQCFTTDCEVCCRPFEVTVECQPGEILSLDAAAN